MAKGAVLYLLLVLAGFQKGQTALVQTQRTVMAALGEEAHFSCQLMQSKDVVQVTWKKLLPGGEKNVATSNKYFGQRVTHDFKGKVEFRDAGLQNCSIVIKKVTEQDEGCYHCLFNAYPEGALTGTTCLQLCELHEPILHVESNSTEEAAVSCSATGRPAPTVTLRVLQQDLHFSDDSSVSVTNTNGTVTVTTTAVLSGFRDNSTQVGCVARVLSGPQIEALMMIPEVKQWSADALYDKLRSDNSDFNWIIVLVVAVACVCVTAATITGLFRLKHHNRLSLRDSENIKTPLKTEHRHETTTPLIQQDDEQVRLRMSSGKNKGSDDPKLSSGSCLQSFSPSLREITTPLTIKHHHENRTPFTHQDDEQVRLRKSTGKNKGSDDPKPSSSPKRCRQKLFPHQPCSHAE